MSSNIESNDRIVIFRNGSIGNTLVAVPLIRSIRKAVPDCHIAVVVDPVGKELLKYCPYVNELILYDKRGYHRPLLRSLTFI
ncbi:MAG: glycosyltransferase family 9 protein, partial [candidate division Zixibacteria bacterium]|nr:glycosyltransferase family 9 protein [candidate division Zixibacteria bacterium]